MWLHVDAAYAGAAAVCPELRDRFAGWERADSVVVNPHKWLGVSMDCSTLWTRKPDVFRDAFSLVPEYLRVAEEVASLSEYTQVLGRRFRALKLWTVLRCYGRAGLQERIREHVRLAGLFEEWVRQDPEWEVVAPRPFSVVCFRRQGSDEANEQLLERVNATGEIFISHTRLADRYVLRLAVGSFRTTEDDVRLAWDVLRRESTGVVSERLSGTYLLGVEPILVFEHDGALVLSLAEVPPEFAARAVPAADGFRLEGGDLEGASLVFAEGDPCPGGVLGGVLGFERAPEGYELPGGRGLDAPPLELDPDEETRYERLLAELLESPDGDWLELGDDRPRWRFVEWLTRQEAVIFHGSPKPDIDVFLPVRSSIEMMDHAGKGNLAAVYGTPVGLWALWFAVIDRSRLRGTIRNGVQRWTDREGRALDLYFFSVDHSHVGGDIWRSGTLYLLPRDSFRPSPLFPGGPDSNEWASPKEVAPLKRLAVDPEDFPFRDRVGGHDDSEVIRGEEISDVVLDRVRGASRVPDGFDLALEWDEEVAAVFDEYLALARKLMPDVDRRLVDSTLEIRGPAGFLQSFEKSLERRGIEVESA